MERCCYVKPIAGRWDIISGFEDGSRYGHEEGEGRDRNQPLVHLCTAHHNHHSSITPVSFRLRILEEEKGWTAYDRRNTFPSVSEWGSAEELVEAITDALFYYSHLHPTSFVLYRPWLHHIRSPHATIPELSEIPYKMSPCRILPL
jgi:hypothetical protein